MEEEEGEGKGVGRGGGGGGAGSLFPLSRRRMPTRELSGLSFTNKKKSPKKKQVICGKFQRTRRIATHPIVC